MSLQKWRCSSFSPQHPRKPRLLLAGMFMCLMCLIWFFSTTRIFESLVFPQPPLPLPGSPRTNKGEEARLKLNSSRLSVIIKRRRKVILFGPHDRYNFGDLLFSKVLARLLVDRAGYDGGDILQGGVIGIDMSDNGGWSDVVGPKLLQERSRSDHEMGPYDIIYTGGESTGCNHDCATKRLMTEEHRRQARAEKIYDCGYLIPKELFRNPTSGDTATTTNNTNYAIMNSLGGAPNGPCKDALRTADYVSFRDRDPLFPDSAVMVRELFGSDVDEAADAVLGGLFGSSDGGPVPSYIAVQHKTIGSLSHRGLARALDEVSKNAGDATIVFFAAGTAPGHDSFDTYRTVASHMSQPVKVCTTTNAWEVVGLISKSSAVLGTSLHVRIMAFIYWKPRLTWCPTGSKHPKFMKLWDAPDAPGCLPYNQHSTTWSVLRKYYGPNPQITQQSTEVAYERIKTQYLKSFDRFSGLLTGSTADSASVRQLV